MSMQNNNSLGNNGLTKEFWKTFPKEMKNPFMNFLIEARRKNQVLLNIKP